MGKTRRALVAVVLACTFVAGGTLVSGPVADDGADGNSPTFITATTGFVIHAPAAWANGAGTLLTTHDGGQTWEPSPFTP
jgi:hypothetical protein